MIIINNIVLYINGTFYFRIVKQYEILYNFNRFLEEFMKLNRTEAREKIMIILYQIDLYVKDNIPYDLENVFHENLEMDNKFVRDVVNGVLENRENIDKVITKYLDNWDLDRLGKTDRAILRLSAYEMLYYSTPNIVVINEAVELAKKYSDDKVVKLINAVLDKIRDNEEVNE